MIKAFVFDLDGTLLNTIDTISYYLNRTLTRHNIEPLSTEECKRFVGSGARLLVERALRYRGIEDADMTEKLLSEYRPDYDSDPYYLTTVYPGISELIDSLIARGIRVAVISNKPDTATKMAVKYFFGDRFTLCRGAIDGLPLKPSGEAIGDMPELLGCDVDEICYVGDSDVDVRFAKAFGAGKCVAVLWGFRNKDELAAAGAEVFAECAADIESKILP